MFSDMLLGEVRDRFAHVDSCPKTGPRIFFENAGGALTLKSAVETSTYYAAIPDNQGRDNEMAHDLVDTINRAKADMRMFFNAPVGDIFVGESGTELLFRLIMNAVLGAEDGGVVLGSTLELHRPRSQMLRSSRLNLSSSVSSRSEGSDLMSSSCLMAKSSSNSDLIQLLSKSRT